MAFKLKKQIKHVEAKWYEFDNETKVLLASIDCPEYQIALARLRREIQRNDSKFAMGEAGVIEGEKTEYDGQSRLLAYHIVRGWEGVQDEEGNPLPFTAENAEALLLGSAEAFLFVIQKASAYSAELREELEESVGKQSPATSGKKSGAAKAKSAP
ncbi:hypothetical protein N015_13355 [Pseudomonas asturiensis]|uniref:Phage tail assembly chaperone n=1 Tax=Pseudomonas asturiensis TaxID=1190415 RepID=A0ABX6HCN4_9PSED|nr:hypothetical protein [Pseudomonas asturiensis]QHF03341.1 hypothetical protein N015_13355 [Pseudomonas asturiensis]